MSSKDRLDAYEAHLQAQNQRTVFQVLEPVETPNVEFPEEGLRAANEVREREIAEWRAKVAKKLGQEPTPFEFIPEKALMALLAEDELDFFGLQGRWDIRRATGSFMFKAKILHGVGIVFWPDEYQADNEVLIKLKFHKTNRQVIFTKAGLLEHGLMLF